MVSVAYEHRVLCDNCGRWVRQERIGLPAFEQIVQEEEPDEDDLFEELQEKPVQVAVTHVPVCGRCQETT